MMLRRSNAGPLALLVACTAALAGCGDDPTDVVFQVIEEATYAPSLMVDLAAMTRTNTGVYYEDLTDGTGDELTFGMTATVDYTGWLTDGTQFDMGSGFAFTMGFSQVIPGWEDGLLGIRVGGTRKLVIPPGRAYGGLSRGIIPPGSILVFDVTVTEASSP